MSTSRFLWAVASISISLVSARADAAEPSRIRSLQAEVSLAEGADLYGVIDVENRVVLLKSRGIALDQVPLTAIALLERSPVSRLGSIEPLELPAVWHVFSKPGGGSRPLLTPSIGRQSEGSQPVVKPQLNVVAPTRYEFPLEEGWTIEVGQFEDAPGLFSRVGEAIQSGFERVVLRAPRSSGRVLRLGMEPADAERLHHVFRKGFAILVVVRGEQRAMDAGSEK